MSRDDSNCQVLILGAGLTGLSASCELSARRVDCVTLEREAMVGGHAVTVEENGYRFDRTGHLLHLRDAERRQKILALFDSPPLTFERQSCIFSEGVYTAYPYQSNTFGLPPQTAYDCVLDFIRAYHREPKPSARNFEDYCRIHFGDAIAERFMLPYNGRLWGVPPSEVTTEWCDRFVPRPNLEDVIAGAVGRPRAPLGYNSTGYYPRLGIGELAQALERRASSVRKCVRIRSIDVRGRRCYLEHGSIDYQVLVSTMPLPSLLALLSHVPSEVENCVRRLRCTPLYYFDVALKRVPRRNFHWVYVPEQRFPFYRVGNYAAFSSAMAPPGAANLYVELSERDAPSALADWPRTVEGLIEMGIIDSASDIEFYRLRHLSHAYVIYDQHRTDSLSSIQNFLDDCGIISTGRYGGWNYSSMEDAISFGEVAATSAILRLA